MYIETDPVSPILKYGEQKAVVEQRVKKMFKEYLILRLGRVVGSRMGDGTLLTSWLDELQKANDIECASDQVFSPVYVEDVIEAILLLIEKNTMGIFHVCGAKPYSRLDLLLMLMRQIKEYVPIAVRVIPRRI